MSEIDDIRKYVIDVIKDPEASGMERLNAIRGIDRLYQTAITDNLTQLSNRQHFLECLERDLDGCNQEEEITVGILDIDHFKHVNDTYGHNTGDLVLRKFAKLLNKHTRVGRHQDFVGVLRKNRRNGEAGRWGGEEFGVYFKDTSPMTAKYTLQRFQNDLTEHANKYVGVFKKYFERNADKFTAEERKLAERAIEELPSISFSAGVAGVTEKNYHAAMKRADHALYEAKSAGRHRVYVSE